MKEKDIYFVLSLFLLFLSIFIGIEGFDIKSDDTINVTGVNVNTFSALPPTGSIVSYLGTGDPDGWVICDGGERPDNSKYDSLIRMTIGTRANGKYYPPDLRNRFLRGQDTIREMGGNGSIKLTIANMPSHSHGGNTRWMNQRWAHSHGGNSGYTSNDHTHGTYDGTVGTVAYSKFNVGHTANATDEGGDPWKEFSLTAYGNRGGNMYDLNTRGQSANHRHSIPEEDINHYHEIPAEGSGTAFDNTPLYYGVKYIVKY